MRWHRSGKWFSVLALLVLVAVALPIAAAQPDGSKIEAALLDRFAAEGTADFIVRFAAQADLAPAYELDWEARGQYVVDALTRVTVLSQARAKDYLAGRGLRHETFIGGNDLYVWAGDLAAANALAAQAEVYFIRAPRTYYIDPIVEEYVAPEATTDWGITDTKADQFWAAFGFQGDGIVVANIDTGVQYDHPALDQAYKCAGDPGSAACWLDPSDICPGDLPCDNNGHGTHTMGTMVSDDDPALTYIAGMAPNAKFIMCKGCESNSCSDEALLACATWLLQPGGSAANRPHVVNNSWGGGGCDDWYVTYVQSWRAAGIFPAFSAGNSTGCGSMGSPGDYQESFASTAHNSSRSHAYAQGPSCYGHEPYTKPNISAPGVSVCSTVPTDAWSCGYSGTSMASPHAAGAVALLWSCNPSLIGQMDLTFEALQDSADAPDPANPTCGVPPDGEGTYEDGYGYLNALAMGQSYCLAADSGYLDGHVFDAGTNAPIAGAVVSAVPGYHVDATTDPSGYYSMSLAAGTYDVTAAAPGYGPETVTGVVIVSDTVTTQDLELTYQGGWLPGPSDPPLECHRFDGVFNPVDSLIYFPGCRTGSSTHDPSIWTYDPVNDVWADTGCDMLHDASNVTAIFLQDDGTGRGEAIYVVGGYDVGLAVNIDAVQRYYPGQPGCLVEDVTSDPYLDASPGGVVVGAAGAAEANGKIYVFGGWESATPYFSANTWEYDPLAAAGSRWTQLDDLTAARSFVQVAVLGDVIYAMGGDVSFAGGDLVPTATVEALDTNDLAAGWQSRAAMPVASAEGRGFGFQSDTRGVDQPAGKLYVVGGGDWPDSTAEAMEYDVATDTWDQAFPDLIEARRNHAGVYVPIQTADPTDGMPAMWVFGGRTISDAPPYGGPEYYPFALRSSWSVYLPVVYRGAP